MLQSRGILWLVKYFYNMCWWYRYWCLKTGAYLVYKVIKNAISLWCVTWHRETFVDEEQTTLGLFRPHHLWSPSHLVLFRWTGFIICILLSSKQMFCYNWLCFYKLLQVYLFSKPLYEINDIYLYKIQKRVIVHEI